MYHNAHRFRWVSEPINIAEYFGKYKEVLPQLPSKETYESSNPQAELSNHMHMMGSDITMEQLQAIDQECDPKLLDIEDEPPSVDVDSIKAKRGLFDGSEVPDGVDLATLQHLRDTDIEKENPAYLKYTSTIWLDDDKGREEDLVPHSEVLLVVRVYEPFKYVNGSRNSRPIACSHEIAVLGEQTLDKLRDKIVCPTDYAVEGDLSENPNNIPEKVAKDIYTSGFFFFENVFYNDFRNEKNIDYSAVIREWAKKKNIGSFGSAVMEKSKFKDLTIRFGHAYVYQHLGNCEHLIVFSDARLLHPSDSLCSSKYPQYLTVCGKKTRYCMICKFYSARWVTLENQRVPYDPCYFCDICFKSYNYKNGEKIGSFRAYLYRDRATIF